VRTAVAFTGLISAGLLPVVWSYVLWRRYQREGVT
jgi:hypothetical protein